MKEIIILSVHSEESYSHSHDSISFVMRNIRQARAIFYLFLKIERFLTRNPKAISIPNFSFEAITLDKDLGKVQILHRSHSDWNYAYSEENYISNNTESMEHAENKVDEFLKENPDSGNAYIADMTISDTLTHEQISDLACEVFEIKKHEFELLKRTVKDFKSGKFYHPENKFKYKYFFRHTNI